MPRFLFPVGDPGILPDNKPDKIPEYYTLKCRLSSP